MFFLCPPSYYQNHKGGCTLNNRAGVSDTTSGPGRYSPALNKNNGQRISPLSWHCHEERGNRQPIDEICRTSSFSAEERGSRANSRIGLGVVQIGTSQRQRENYRGPQCAVTKQLIIERKASWTHGEVDLLVNRFVLQSRLQQRRVRNARAAILCEVLHSKILFS